MSLDFEAFATHCIPQGKLNTTVAEGCVSTPVVATLEEALLTDVVDIEVVVCEHVEDDLDIVVNRRIAFEEVLLAFLMEDTARDADVVEERVGNIDIGTVNEECLSLSDILRDAFSLGNGNGLAEVTDIDGLSGIVSFGQSLHLSLVFSLVVTFE